MKKLILAAIFPWLIAFFGNKALAQDTPKATENKKETQEITIRKKGDKDVTLNLQISGDKVTVNGKPLIEFNDDGITINNKKIVITDKDFHMDFDGMDFNDILNNQDVMVQGFRTGSPRAFLGVYTEKTDAGAKINSVSKESAAEAAGLKKDDVIIKVNDTKVNGPEELSELIGKMKPKDEVKVTYKRGTDKEKTVKATLKETKGGDVRSLSITSPDGNIRSFGFPSTPGIPRPPRTPGQGMTWNDDGQGDNMLFNNITVRGRQKLGIKIQDTEEGNGVKILDVDVESPAEKAGIKKDDILTELNGNKISNTDEAREQLQVNAETNSYPVKIKRNGSEMTLTVKIPKKLKTTTL